MTDTVNRMLGDKCAIVLKYGTTDIALKGINKLKFPGMTRSTVTSQEFGVEFDVEDVVGGKHSQLTFGGNMLEGDPGQIQLKTYLKDNTHFTDCRVYSSTDTGNFLTPDTAQDSNAGFQVISFEPGEVGKNGTFPFSSGFAVNGLYATFTVHRKDVVGVTLGFVASATPTTVGGTITDSTSHFVVNGFAAGQTLIIEGSTSNDGMYIIRTAAAGLLTLEVAGTNSGQLATEASPGVACELHGGNF
jgi:hypothetical protein